MVRVRLNELQMCCAWRMFQGCVLQRQMQFWQLQRECQRFQGALVLPVNDRGFVRPAELTCLSLSRPTLRLHWYSPRRLALFTARTPLGRPLPVSNITLCKHTGSQSPINSARRLKRHSRHDEGDLRLPAGEYRHRSRAACRLAVSTLDAAKPACERASCQAASMLSTLEMLIWDASCCTGCAGRKLVALQGRHHFHPGLR